MKRILFIPCFFIITIAGNSQPRVSIQLSGKVMDLQTGLPLPGASISLAETRVGTTSDSSGSYRLYNVPSGHTIIEVSYSGYQTLIMHLDITSNTIQDFRLTSTILVNEGITITAVGNATSMRKAPIPISRINKNELLNLPSTNIIDALSHQPGISQLSSGPAISKPIIRGLGYNRLVVINDGIRQEGQQWGDEHGIEIDENSISRVEIVKGPSSLIYGSDAMAGVINIITAAPVENNTVKGTILTGYQTANRQKTLYASLAGNQHGYNWNAWGDYKAAGDYKNKYDGRVFNSKFNEHNYGGYAGYNGRWGFTHFIVSNFNQKLGMIEGSRNEYGNFVKNMPGGAAVTASGEDFTTTAPKIPYQHVQHFKIISDNSFKTGANRISLNLGWQRNQRKEFGEPDNANQESLFFDLKTFNYNTIYHLTDKNGWSSSVGLNGMMQNNQNKGDEVLIPEYKIFDAGAFFYNQKTIGKSTISGGIRYDKRDINSKEFKEGSDIKFAGFKKKFYNLSGSAGISYAASNNFLIKANLAHGFRAPSIPELASNGAHEGTNRYEYGNLNLKSESSWQGDVGVELNSDHVLINAATFINHINNFIFYSKLLGASGSDSLVAVDNNFIPAFQFAQQSATLMGGEILIDIHPHPLDWFHWENTLSVVRGKFSQPIDGSINVPLIPATRWNSEVRGEFLPKGKKIKDLNIHFEASHSFARKKVFTAYGTETQTPGYTLLNAGISTTIMKSNRPLFSIYFMGINLGDVAYQSHLSRLKYTEENRATGRRGVFNTGRNFIFKVNIPLQFETPKTQL